MASIPMQMDCWCAVASGRHCLMPRQGLRNVGADGVEIVRDANASSFARMGEDETKTIRDALGPLHASLLAIAENVA